MTRKHVDEWTIERWRIEPRLIGLEFDESTLSEQAPPLWKDLTVASAIAVVLWVAAVIVFG
jgi:hypothetical protein